MGAIFTKDKLPYNEIASRVEHSYREYTRLCASHYAFINRRFSVRNHAILTQFVQGIAMEFRGNVTQSVKMSKLKRERASYIKSVTDHLQMIISYAPKSQREITLVRAHHFDTPPIVGSVFENTLPMSTTMFHPFSVEWIAERRHPLAYKPVILIIRVKAGTGGMLCVGCPVPYECSPEHQRTFRVGPRTDWVYQGLTQNQIQSQSEVILNPGKFKVTGNGDFRLSDIRNLNRYGFGWYTSVKNKMVNEKQLIKCVFVDRYK